MGLPLEGIKDLSEKYNRSIPWIRKQILDYEIQEKTHNPRSIVIVCDATFYGRRKEREACPWGIN